MRPMTSPWTWIVRRKSFVQTLGWTRREKSRLLEAPKHAGARGAARLGLTWRESRT